MDLKGTIVFSSGKQGDYDIWTLNLESKEIKQLTSGSSKNDCPKWSPDGKQIAYISDRTGTPEIWIMNEDGSNDTQITKQGKYHQTPDWSPDGSRLVFCANYDGNRDIYTMNVDGSDLKQITDYEGADYVPQYSPDGTKIIFTSKASGNDDVWSYDVSTGSLNQLTKYEGKDYMATYSPDGKYIAFVTGIFDKEGRENYEVFVMDADGDYAGIDYLEPVTVNRGEDRHVAWSPDGKYLIYTSSKPKETVERLTVSEFGSLKKGKRINLDRSELDNEIDSAPKSCGIFTFLPDAIIRKFYPESHFGTERYPDWKY